jgi:hypothetical protein
VSDTGDDLTDELRRALHRDPAAASRHAEEDLLASVHAGARRRRARRAAAVGAVGALAAGTVLAVALPLTEREPELAAAHLSGAEAPESSALSGPAPPADRTPEVLLLPRAGRSTPVEPTDVRARAVTAAGPEESWLLGDGDCAGADCVVIGRAEGGDRSPTEFHVGPGRPGSAMTMRMATNGEDGWVVSGGELFATHDSASTWAAVEAPMATVDDVVTSSSSVWVTGEKEGRPVVASAPVDEDEFKDAGLPPGLGTIGSEIEPAVTGAAGGETFGFLREGDGAATFVAHHDAKGWASHETPDCREALSLSGTSTALWAICGRGQEFTPMVSADGGLTWDLVEVDKHLGGDSSIAAIDPDRALVHNGFELYLLNGGELLRSDPPAEGAGGKRYDHLSFVDVSTGFLIDAEGVLSRSDNGGTTWEPVDLP